MGNCLANEAGPDVVRIMTDSGGIMELESPVNVQTVVSDFPGYGIFRRGNVGSPLPHHEKLLSGHLYYLLPVPKEKTAPATEKEKETETETETETEAEAEQVQVAPVRLSTTEPSDLQSMEVLPSPGKGVWRVKMVIRRDELADILSEQGNTEALIERLRLAATSSEAQRKRAWSSWASS
ncbi:hypothetical protein H6P81_014367 [Aristolochia fimbriata]|uniref:Uncharacterized protein n=1 Tax=Aristolochia fimbriata TaxID=158543 RepID=A0AAV7EIU1_ARIFI|nr:hypothetical protein H6P81_014367 [Aristolochia fimbriata]